MICFPLGDFQDRSKPTGHHQQYINHSTQTALCWYAAPAQAVRQSIFFFSELLLIDWPTRAQFDSTLIPTYTALLFASIYIAMMHENHVDFAESSQTLYPYLHCNEQFVDRQKKPKQFGWLIRHLSHLPRKTSASFGIPASQIHNQPHRIILFILWSCHFM